MCGIFGVLSRDRISTEILSKASEAIDYRGRDFKDSFKDDHIYLSHTRLSIIDVINGNQPMRDSANRSVIVFNGEIYNYIELREDLERSGINFKTDSDTEVLLNGFNYWGKEVFNKLEGMYAGAIWDSSAKELHLFRDPLGKKPLCIWEAKNGLIAFSSTSAAFKALPFWENKINSAAILMYSFYGMLSDHISIFEGVRKVRPGSLETYNFRTNLWDKYQFSNIHFNSISLKGKSKREVEEKFLFEFKRSVKMRCRSDVPVGLTFSGGVDSGLIACILKENGYKLPLFNIDYETSTNLSPERRNARVAAGRLGFDLIEIDFKPENLFAALPNSYKYYDEPCSQLTMVYYLEVLEYIRSYGIKVVLSGNGADELFFGYRGENKKLVHNDAINLLRVICPERFFPKKIRELKRNDWVGFYIRKRRENLIQLWKLLDLGEYPERESGIDSYLESLGQEMHISNINDYLDYLAYLNLRINGSIGNYLLPDINGLQAQVEVRSPFLDWGLINFIFSMDNDFKIGSYFTDKHTKNILKKHYAASLGKDLAYDKKRGMGWNIRWDRWMVDEPVIKKLFIDTISQLSDYNVNPKWFLDNFERYCGVNSFAASGGGEAVTGFMLALWLVKEFKGMDAMQDILSPAENFMPTGVYPD